MSYQIPNKKAPLKQVQKKRKKQKNRFREIVPSKTEQARTEEYIADMQYLQWLQERDTKCFVCGKQNGIEWHHVKEYSTDKKNHKRLIPLCGVEHHRLGDLSPHGNPKRWRETFTMQQQNEFADEFYKEYKELIS